jgi:hypothetical protein
MADVNKKVAAALAAVNAYLQEEEALSMQSKTTMPAPHPTSSLNIWGLSGRQEMMSMRQLIQMKAFTRF